MAELAAYFREDEISAARKHIEIFHGKFLLSDDLGRVERVLIAIYMLSNEKKASVLSSDELKEFATARLGMNSENYSKGVYDAKQAEYISERDKAIGLTFKGLKKIRDLLTVAGERE